MLVSVLEFRPCLSVSLGEAVLAVRVGLAGLASSGNSLASSGHTKVTSLSFVFVIAMRYTEVLESQSRNNIYMLYGYKEDTIMVRFTQVHFPQ